MDPQNMTPEKFLVLLSLMISVFVLCRLVVVWLCHREAQPPEEPYCDERHSDESWPVARELLVKDGCAKPEKRNG